jgi:hypothetical protein
MDALVKLVPELIYSRVLVFGFEFFACVHSLVKLASAPDVHLQRRKALPASRRPALFHAVAMTSSTSALVRVHASSTRVHPGP